MITLRKSPDESIWRKILGKTIPQEYPLIRHLVDTGATASVIFERVLTKQQINIMLQGFNEEADEKLLKDFIVYLSAMHDIGKAHPHWQKGTLQLAGDFYGDTEYEKLPENSTDRLRDHSKNSAAYFSENIPLIQLSRKPLLAASKIVHAHHGTFHPSLDDIDKIGLTPWINEQQSIEKEILSVLGFGYDHFSQIKSIEQTTALLISGVVILADWIASREDFILAMDSRTDYKEQYQNALNQAEKFLLDYGIQSPEYKDVLWESLFPFEPNSLQKSVIDLFNDDKRKSGLLIISAPMGMGKTETSLYAAAMMSSRCEGNGFWFALPTKATTNAIFERCESISKDLFKGSVPVSLMHSSSSLVAALDDFKVKRPLASNQSTANIDDNDASYISEYLAERKLGGFSTVSVSTIDQLIVSNLKFKHNALRWLAIAGKTLILDEVHDFDEYTFEIIQSCVQWAGHLGIPVIVMSATLSGESQRKLIAKYKGVTTEIAAAGIAPPAWIFSNQQEVKVSSKIEEPPYPIYDLTIKEIDNWLPDVKDIVARNTDKTVLITCHTVDQAIATRDALSHFSPALLHSRMEPQKKNSVIDELLEITGKNGNRKPYVLVSTQIVQQSMDIDFDILITPLAPLPQFLQRVGRVARHERTMASLPEIHVLIPSEKAENAVIPYEEWDLFITKKVLEVFGTCQIDIKKSLYRFFEEYVRLSQVFKDEASNRIAQTNRSKREYQGQNVVITDARRLMQLDQVTASFTQKSKYADTTRIFPETKQIVIVSDGKFFDGTQLPDLIHKNSLRAIGLRTFGITAYMHKLMVSTGWEEREIGLDYMVGLERVNSKSPIMYDENDGLINLEGGRFWQ